MADDNLFKSERQCGETLNSQINICQNRTHLNGQFQFIIFIRSFFVTIDLRVTQKELIFIHTICHILDRGFGRICKRVLAFFHIVKFLHRININPNITSVAYSIQIVFLCLSAFRSSSYTRSRGNSKVVTLHHNIVIRPFSVTINKRSTRIGTIAQFVHAVPNFLFHEVGRICISILSILLIPPATFIAIESIHQVQSEHISCLPLTRSVIHTSTRPTTFFSKSHLTNLDTVLQHTAILSAFLYCKIILCTRKHQRQCHSCH